MLISGIIASSAQYHSEQEIDQMSDLFSIDEEMFITDTSSNIYHMPHQIIITPALYSHDNVLHIISNTINRGNILVIANSSVYSSIEEDITQYAHDIHYAHQIGVDVEVCTNANYMDIKNLILAYANNLIGVVLVGDIDVAYYETANDHNKYGYKSWPCDLYYMDLDGSWWDNDSNGIFDAHTGNVQPEIFVGRISAFNMGNLLSEIAGLKYFFNKDHQYWIGNVQFNHRALAYNNKDWQYKSYFSSGIAQLFGEENSDVCNCVNCTDFSKDDYVAKNISGTYGFIQLAAHSSPLLHQFDCTTMEYIYANNLYNIPNDALGYNLFCCSACNWKSAGLNGYIGGAYLFNSPTSLFVVGSTKTGSLLYFNNFYNPLGNNDCVGEALRKWWVNTFGNTHNSTQIYWHYGLSILGDPMAVLNNLGNCQDTITINMYDTTNQSNVQIYRASNQITIGNNYQLPTGKKLILDAPTVLLNPMFSCPLGSSIEVKNEGCFH